MDKKRREFLAASAAVAGGCMVPVALGAGASAPMPAPTPARIRFDPAPFTLGVASGDPTASAVVIWTRLAPEPLAVRGGLTTAQSVTWTVASDERLSQVVARGTVTADPAMAGAVHVDVTGLKPDTTYFYGFATADGARSVVGRTRTLPAGTAERLRLAVVSCQHIGQGHYGAFTRIVEEQPDLIVHLGDYIYEYPLDRNWPAVAQSETQDLDSYRARYALYRGEPQLRAAHQAVPWTLVWDNHEVVANHWADTRATARARRAAAYQAWYEHMPIRPPAGLPNPARGFRIYRQLSLGGLVDLMMIDVRQYRDHPPCTPFQNPVNCREQDLGNARRTMLGTEQKDWLKQSLSQSKAHWRCIGSPVLFSDLKLGGIAGYTAPWQGYQAERSELMQHIADQNMRNLVVLSGDWHRAIVCNVKADFDDITTPDLASEFCGTSLTSTGDGDRGGLSTFQSRLNFYPLNLHLRFYESEQHGYFICDVTKTRWRSTYRSVDRRQPSAPAQTLAVFETVNGTPGVNVVSGDGANPFPRGKS